MSSTEVVISPAAKREIKKLTKDQRRQAISLLRSLENGSATLTIEKIKGQPSYFRIRHRDLRVVYHYLTRKRVVILVVRDRKDAYRGLEDLDKKLFAALRDLGERQAASL